MKFQRLLPLTPLLPLSGCVSSSAPPAAPSPPRVVVPAPASPKPVVDRAALQALLEREAERLPGRVAIHVRVEDGSAEGIGAGVNAERAMPAASVAKLPVVLALEQAWLDGTLKRSEADVERARAAITVSDNEAADALISRLTPRRINAWLQEHGYRTSKLERPFQKLVRGKDNPMTAAESTRMLLQVVAGKAVSPAASKEVRGFLLAQTRRSRLPAGLPPEAVSGNKTGTFGGAVNDVAFVEPPGGPRYAVAVFLAEVSSRPKAEKALARFSAAVYRLVKTPS